MFKHELIYLDTLCQHFFDIILKIIHSRNGYSNQTALSCQVKSLFICIHRGFPAFDCSLMAGGSLV